jgi:hypothetical protein
MSENLASFVVPLVFLIFFGRSAVLGSLPMVASSCRQALVTLSAVVSVKSGMASIFDPVSTDN